MDWKISSSVCVLCSRVSQFYINKWVLYAWVVGWSHVCMHTWRAQKATELIMYSSFQFIAGWNCYVSETDSSDMVTVPVVFVSSQLSVIRDMTEAPVFTTKKRKSSAPHSGLSVNDATKHRQDEFSQLRHALCCLSLSGIRLKSSCIHFFDV